MHTYKSTYLRIPTHAWAVVLPAMCNAAAGIPRFLAPGNQDLLEGFFLYSLYDPCRDLLTL